MRTKLLSVVIFGLLVSFSSVAQNSYVQITDNALPIHSNSDIGIVNYNPNQNKGLANSDFCDDFNVPNTTTIDGWTEESGDWQIIDEMLRTPGGSSQEIILDGSSQADGIITVRGVYEAPVETKFVGILARRTASNSKILFKIQDNSSNGNWNYYFVYIPGTSTLSGSGDFGTDAIFQLEYVGADITIRIDSDRDGIWDHTNSTTTTYLADGLCGIEGYGTASIDAFCLGEYNITPPPPPSVPISNWAIILGFLTIISIVTIRFIKL